MATTRSGAKPELELLPAELYGNIRGPLQSRDDDSESLNPALQGGVFEQMYHRNVYHIAALYLLSFWVLANILPWLLKELQWPTWIAGAGAGMAVVGFPFAMYVAWSQGLTASGWKPVEEVQADESLAFQARTQLNRAIVSVMGVGIVFLASARFLLPAGAVDPATARIATSEATHETPAAPAPAAVTAAPAAPATSIAVLAFTAPADAKDLGYLANGFSEELPPVLGMVPQVAVTSANSSYRRFSSAGTDLVATGAALGVRYLVSGSVRRVDDQAQIVVQLVDAHDGTQRWTQTYERDVANAMQLREDIAVGIAKALAIPVGADDLHVRRLVKNPEALDLYLRGRQAAARGDRYGCEQAADLYRQALDLDPQSATVETAVAELNLAMVQAGFIAPQAGVERARQAAEIANAHDTNIARTHRVLAWIHSRYDWDWHTAERDLNAARSLDPHDANVMADLGRMNLSFGQFDNAAQNLQAAIALDPLDAGVVLDLGLAQFWGGHRADAEATVRKALQLDPKVKSAHFYLGQILLAGGDAPGALAEVKNEPDVRHRLAGMAEVLFAMGRKAESDAALAQLRPLATAEWGSGLAAVYATRNDPDDALQWLDRAYAQHDADLQILRGNPSFQNVSSDPRFLEFQRKINLPG